MPETLAGSGDGQQSASGLHNARGPQPAIGLIFNVSAEEAARRLHVARALLADAGVNPDTLSEAQMNIFANQSPDLQKDSVAMLAKYGAERLQIVEPNEKEKAGPGQPTSAAAGSISDHVNADSVTTTELMPSAQAQEEMEQGNVFQRVGANSADNENSGDRQRATRKLGKSRLACSSCKARKVKVGSVDDRMAIYKAYHETVSQRTSSLRGM